MATVAVVTVFP